MKNLEKLIKQKLEKTKDCRYKRVFIPRGWACVPIKNFSKLLANEIMQKLEEQK